MRILRRALGGRSGLGFISFGLVFVKEEVLRWAAQQPRWPRRSTGGG